MTTRKRPATRRMKLGPPDYVVLGMLGLGRRSGYEIKQTVALSIRFFWTISHAQIYPALDHLEALGLIRGRDDPKGRRARRNYRITPAGTRALETWLRRKEDLPFELRDVGLVKLFFADSLDLESAAELMATIRLRSAERLTQFDRIRSEADAEAHEGRVFPGVTLRLGVAFHRAIVAECDAMMRDLKPANVRRSRPRKSASRRR